MFSWFLGKSKELIPEYIQTADHIRIIAAKDLVIESYRVKVERLEQSTEFYFDELQAVKKRELDTVSSLRAVQQEQLEALASYYKTKLGE